jgi:endonuclease/exonuclease/phosphatase family metal-dependent hydrolase
MRVAIYNQMFALDGRRFFSNIFGHWAVHFQNNEGLIWKMTDLKRIVQIVQKSKADVIGICEVLEKQQAELKEMMNSIGYRYIYFGQGHKLKHHEMHVTEAIASKVPCKRVEIGKWLVEDRLGGGGGLVCVYIPKLDAYLISVHLALPSRRYFYPQIEFLAEKIKNLDGKVILIGDFNMEYEKIKKYFPGLQLFSNKIKSCSMTPLMKLFCNKDLDHIFVRGFDPVNTGSLNGYSDHKLVYADLK